MVGFESMEQLIVEIWRNNPETDEFRFERSLMMSLIDG
jgi:hypothetical protein